MSLNIGTTLPLCGTLDVTKFRSGGSVESDCGFGLVLDMLELFMQAFFRPPYSTVRGETFAASSQRLLRRGSIMRFCCCPLDCVLSPKESDTSCS